MALEQFRPVGDPKYYLGEPTINTPTFEGKGAKLLGIEGQPISSEQFLSLCDGYLLDGDRSIKLPKYMHPERRAAFEMTANLPKDPSVLNLIGKDTRIDDLLDRATRKVAREVEKNARVRVTKKSEVEKSKATMPKGWKFPERKSDNLVWVAFDHYASRGGDPHRHRHIVFMNLSHDKQERTWKAIELRYVDQAALGELFRREMMTGLRQLGYKVRAKGKEYEIIGFPAEIKGQFSSRHHQIKEIEAEYDERAKAAGNKPMGKKERQKLSVYQRPEKTVMTLELRVKQWVSELTERHYGAVKSLVAKAKHAVIDQWKSRLSRHAEQTRSQEREVEHERVY